MAELPFSITGVPDAYPLYEYTLTIWGGTPSGRAVPYYFDDATQTWMHLFDPNVIPYIQLDVNGEATFVFKSPSDYFLTAQMKVEGVAAPPTPPNNNLLIAIGALAAITIGLAYWYTKKKK